MTAEYRILINRFCKTNINIKNRDNDSIDNLNDEFMISSNLAVKVQNGSYELYFVEKKGLYALFEIQKMGDSSLCFENLKLYAEYLFQNGATYLALFIMKNHKLFNTEAVNVAIENSISINSKVTYYISKFLFKF